MNNKRVAPLIISPFDSYEDFKLPDSPPKEKFINIDDSADLPEPNPTAQIIEKVKVLPINLRNAISQAGSTFFDTDDDDSPKTKAVRQLYYSYFRGLVNEQQAIKETEPDDAEVVEATMQERYERMIEAPMPEQNLCLYVTKRSSFDLLKMYTDQYPFLETRRFFMFIKK